MKNNKLGNTLRFFLVLILFTLFITKPQEIQAAGNVSPLIFGDNLHIDTASDPFVTSQAFRDGLTKAKVQMIRMPIRSAQGVEPDATEKASMQNIKAMNAVPLIILHWQDTTGSKNVIQYANSIFGNSIVYYEYSNEKDGSWNGGYNAQAYTQSWDQTISQLKSLPTNGAFGGPVNYHADPQYVSYFYKNANPKPDFLSWHEYTCPYTDSNQQCLDNITNWTTHITATRQAVGTASIPFMITEWNYSPDAGVLTDNKHTDAVFLTAWTTKALQTLADNNIFASNHYDVQGVLQLAGSSGSPTIQGQIFSQMFTQLVGQSGNPLTTPPLGTSQTPTSTISTSGNQTTIGVTAFLHGLGNSGDNANPTSHGNQNPTHPTRTVAVSILNGTNQQIASGNGSLSYNQTGGNFTGNVAIGNIPNGQYIIVVKTQGFLSKQAAGIFTVANNQTVTIPPVTEVNGDINNDNQLDIIDYNMLLGCFGSKASTASCTDKIGSDINDDGNIDGSDYNLFLRELSVQSGTNNNPTPSTANPTPSHPQITSPPVTISGKLFGVNIAGADFGGSATYAGNGYSGYSYYHGKGLTLMRLPFLWEHLQPTLMGALSADADKYGGMIQAAGAAGDQVIIDPHNYARYNGTPLAAGDGAKLADFWTKLATKFKSYNGVWGYELMNEPHDLAGGCQTWQTLAQASVTAIRQVDTTHYILIPGYSWQAAMSWPSSSGCLSAVHDPANKMIFSAHEYFDADNSGTHGTPCPPADIGVQRLQPFTSWLAQNNAKGIVTEYGAAVDACWLTTLDNFMKQLQSDPNIIGGTYWAGGPAWGSYFMSVEPSGNTDKPQMSVLKNYPSK